MSDDSTAGGGGCLCLERFCSGLVRFHHYHRRPRQSFPIPTVWKRAEAEVIYFISNTRIILNTALPRPCFREPGTTRRKNPSPSTEERDGVHGTYRQ
jgi:hypothetical protein